MLSPLASLAFRTPLFAFRSARYTFAAPSQSAIRNPKSYADLRPFDDSGPCGRHAIRLLERHGLASGFASILGGQLLHGAQVF